jgi:putative DNA primase/helicase
VSELLDGPPEYDPLEHPGAQVIPHPSAKQGGLPEFADEALALKFTSEYGRDLRHVEKWGKWLVWSGLRWEIDETNEVLGLVRQLCRREAARAISPAQAKSVGSAKTIRAVEYLIRADRTHAASAEQWDADPWLLNTPDGVIDLRNGSMREHRQADYMTRITAASPQAGCPRWLRFLDTVTAGDGELRAFLRRVAGYALTGLTVEHALFFAYGTGGNGKGRFLEALQGVMGGYAVTASMETFTASKHDHHPTDLAMLRGARLVTAQETEEGRRWAEARIKAMTGGDPITARFMRQDFFTYHPVFKLFISGNHKPGIQNVDEAMRRRMNLVPFVVKVMEPDVNLGDKLKEEWPGILAWAIQGCLEWQSGGGLKPPPCVLSATNSYFEAEDTMRLWITENCTESPTLFGELSSLFRSYKEWCERAGEYVGQRKRFAQALETRGYKPALHPDRNNRRAGYFGLALKPETRDERGYG